MVAKRVNIDWKFQPKKCSKRCYSDTDRISQLPDDVLVTILSFLSMKEAARTSVLSPRWINLWKHTSSLEFRADSALAKIAENYELCGEERRKYVEWVNRILRSHKAVILKEFTICFDLDLSSSESITQWLEFAFMRHVQKLELDFSVKFNKRYPPTRYTLPDEFLTQSIAESSCVDFKPLKELSLKCVDLTAEAIETLLRICPSLEKLVVHYTDKISNLEVCGPSLALKHLELEFCDLESVRVSAPNLITLIGPKVEVLLLENVPMLAEVSVTCICMYPYPYDSFEKLIPTLSCCISQLENLFLNMFAHKKEIDLPTFPELTKLKKLVIEYWTEGNKRLMGLTPLISASPNLQEFVLKLKLSQRSLIKGQNTVELPSRSHREVMNTTRLAHHHLKVFKFCGYYGRASDVELVRYILENSVVLEKIIIDPFNPILCGVKLSAQMLKDVETVRGFAKQQLEGRVPHHVELVIL